MAKIVTNFNVRTDNENEESLSYKKLSPIIRKPKIDKDDKVVIGPKKFEEAIPKIIETEDLLEPVIITVEEPEPEIFIEPVIETVIEKKDPLLQLIRNSDGIVVGIDVQCSCGEHIMIKMEYK
jgi:hypothetical protein